MNLNYIDILPDYIDLLNLKKSSSQLKQREEFKELDWFFNFNDITLPENWLVVNILDVTWIVTCGVAKKPNYIETGIPFLSAQNARPFKTNLNKIKFISEKDFKTFTVGAKPDKNDILYTRVGNCGEAAKISYDFDFAIYVSLTLIKPIHELINSDYLVAFLNSTYGLSQASVGAIGTGLKNLNVNNVRKFKIPLPPLAEQNRIVDKLDRLFAQLETIKASMSNIPLLLKDFRKQVLTQAVTGKLTVDWRNGKELESSETLIKTTVEKRIIDFDLKCKLAKQKGERKPLTPEYFNYSKKDLETHSINSWFQSPVGFLCDCIVPGRDKPKSFTGTIPWITTPDLISDYITDKDGRLFLSEIEIDEVKAKIIPINSVVISIVGRFGISCVTKVECVINQQLHAYLPSDLVVPEYLMFHIKTQENLMNDLSSSTTIAYINKTKANSIPINVPSLQEQQEIVRRVESLFAKADAIEQQYRALKAKIDTLPQAILHKAFKGELSEQLDTDGDARELLKEIKALKAATGKVIKSKTNKNTAKKVKPYRETEEVLGMVAEGK